ncbi:MAG: hypothetical protein J5556_04385, partial [Deltaproteobacteria bacterium]|nr:hypothetical protein [Deltaproteobacteria bacterium]
TMKEVSSSVADSVESVKDLTETNRRIGTEFSQSTAALQNTTATLGTSAESFTQTANETSAQYSQLAGQYRNMQQELQNVMNAYAQQVEQMMDGYAKQVKEMMDSYSTQLIDQTAKRLRAWDNETQNFCTSMKNVVVAIAELVNEYGNARIR